MNPEALPDADCAVIGGSGTHGCSFPEDAGCGARVIDQGLTFKTPWGESPAFSIFETAAGRRCLTVRIHGWRDDVPRGQASRQVFWVLSTAGVRRIISEAGVGSLNPLLDPRDVVVPDDYVDLTHDRGAETVTGGTLLIMRNPVCGEIASALTESARKYARGRVFDRGTCVVTEGPRFESRAEVRMMQPLGDVIGQSMCPEVWLARDIGACYAALYTVVNYAEGVVRDWEHDVLKEIFIEDATVQARIILDAIDAIPDHSGCSCSGLRPPTLLG